MCVLLGLLPAAELTGWQHQGQLLICLLSQEADHTVRSALSTCGILRQQIPSPAGAAQLHAQKLVLSWGMRPNHSSMIAALLPLLLWLHLGSCHSPELHALQLSRVVPKAIIKEGPVQCELGNGSMLPEIGQLIVPYRV